MKVGCSNRASAHESLTNGDFGAEKGAWIMQTEKEWTRAAHSEDETAVIWDQNAMGG
jgi:hypothetical protein